MSKRILKSEVHQMRHGLVGQFMHVKWKSKLAHFLPDTCFCDKYLLKDQFIEVRYNGNEDWYAFKVLTMHMSFIRLSISYLLPTDVDYLHVYGGCTSGLNVGIVRAWEDYFPKKRTPNKEGTIWSHHLNLFHMKFLWIFTPVIFAKILKLIFYQSIYDDV